MTATAALEEVKQSTKFAKILELILLIGNYMNAGSRNEQTLAFEFSFITKVCRSDYVLYPTYCFQMGGLTMLDVAT